MLTIRFNRVGKRNKAQFRIVVQEHTVAPGGRHIEVLGSWDPHQKKADFKDEKIKYWMEKGAKVSDSVWNLLVKNNIISGPKRAIKISKKTEEENGEESKVQRKEETKEEKPAEAKKEKAQEVKEEKKKEVLKEKEAEKADDKDKK